MSSKLHNVDLDKLNRGIQVLREYIHYCNYNF